MSKVFSVLFVIIIISICVACANLPQGVDSTDSADTQAAANTSWRIDYFTGLGEKDLIRYPDNYINEKVFFTSYTIHQIYEPKLYLAKNGSKYLIIDDRNNDGPNGIEGDPITVYGRFQGNDMVTWLDGSNEQVPYIVADRLIFNNIAPDEEEFAQTYVEFLNMSQSAFSIQNQYISGTQVKLICKAVPGKYSMQSPLLPFDENRIEVDGYNASSFNIYYDGLQIGYEQSKWFGPYNEDVNFDVLPVTLLNNDFYVVTGNIYYNINNKSVDFYIADIKNWVSTLNFSEKITPAWKQLYIDYIKDFLADPGTDYKVDNINFYLMYIDNDKIPELLIELDGFHSKEKEARIITVYDNKLTTETIGRYFESFVKCGNIFISNGYNEEKNVLYNRIYWIDKGQFKVLHEIEMVYLGYSNYEYNWGGQTLSEEEYQNKLNEIIDVSEAKNKYEGEGKYLNCGIDLVNYIIELEEPVFQANKTDDFPSGGYKDTDTQEVVEKIETEDAATGEETETQEVKDQYDIENLPVWKQLYINYIKSITPESESSFYEGDFFYLIYVDNDNIPELLVLGSYASGTRICTVYNDSLMIEIIGNYHPYYIERENILVSYGGKETTYNDIYTIKEGQFVVLHEGRFGPVNLYSLEAPIYEYYWDGQKVTGDEYNKYFSEAFDMSRAAKYGEDCKADEMINKIIAWD